MTVSHLLAAALFAAAGAPEGRAPDAEMKNHTQTCGLPDGEGVIDALDVAKSSVTLKHEPVAALGWPEKTATFVAAKSVDLSAFGTGERVHFLLAPQRDKTWRIASLCSFDVGEGAHEACMKSMHETAMKVAAGSGKSCGADGGAKAKGHEGHH